ncbi:MAG: homoserine kinase [Thermaerobacterales bacterium]
MPIEVSVSATAANLGPGFDCIGLALEGFELQGRLTVGTAATGIRVSGLDTASISRDSDNLVGSAMAAVFSRAGRDPGHYQLEIFNQIPVARGLGSSAAAIVAGLLLAAGWLRTQGLICPDDDLINIGAELEGHSDNVVAALVGGVTVAARCEDTVRWQSLPVANLPPVLVAVPAAPQATAAARNLLPAFVLHQDAVFNISRSGLLLTALINGDYRILREAMTDRLHEPYRLPLYPWLTDLRAAALEAGAYGVCLSGAGPATLAFVPEPGIVPVAEAMAGIYERAGLAVQVHTTRVAGSASTRPVPA